ncbi:hypothetical protein U1872_17380 [Sphingomonas sp. RB3P16]|uniref:hypothetical protein n=1 Tax=Parasphingomonas frigoris TaxID=3096163 RepID=UPI002FC647F2
MTHDKHADAPNPRARKLKLESDNCLAIAIREREPEVAAMLIDEAAKLARRVNELRGKR